MLRVLGGPKRFCDGLTRRELLQVGSLGLLGLGLAAGASSVAGPGRRVPAPACRGSARPRRASCSSCTARPASLRRSTPSPTLPSKIRGELGCIPSSVPGLNVCERLPRLAQVMDKVSLIRSVSHPYPIHGVAFATTGNPRIDIPMELNPRDAEPLAVHRLGGRPRRRTRAEAEHAAPRRPCRATSCFPGPSAVSGSAKWPAPVRTAGSSGQAYDPICTEFVGKGTKKASKTLTDQVWEDVEPYRGITPESRFQLERGRPSRPRADARPARRPPHAARADRAVSPRRPTRRRSRRASIAIARWPTTCSARKSCARLSTWARRPTRRATSTA